MLGRRSCSNYYARIPRQPFDLSDDGDDDFPVGSGSDIESETEEEYTESDTTDEDELEQNILGTGPISKRRTGCWTREGIRESINMSGERRGTQPPQNERPGALRITEEGESSRDKNGDTVGNEKDNHRWITEVNAPPIYPFQANSGVLIETPENLRPTFFFYVFLNDEVIEFFVAKTNSYAEKVCQNMIVKRNSRFQKWKPTNATEMRVFIGFVLHMGVIDLPRLSNYWSNDPMYKTYL